MADYSANVATMARLLAIAHIVIGTLLICFGIADRLVEYYDAWTGYVFFGVWIGIWMCITGGLGIPGSGRLRTGSRNAFASIFMGFSITSAVFGGIIIICYSVVIASLHDYHDYYNDYHVYHADYDHDSKLAILAVMLILGIATFVVGIWAAICCCLLQPCCTQQQGQQTMYNANPSAGYVMTEASGGFSVAVPVQRGGGMVAAQGGQPPMVVVPVSGASGTKPVIGVQAASSDVMATVSPTQQIQPQFAQINPRSATSATDSQPQQAERPRSYGRGGYMPLQNEEID